MQTTLRLTLAQALIRYLIAQSTERDGVARPFFGGCFGIFGHGNIAGVGEALRQYPALRYYQSRNEQAMVHAAAAYARHSLRLQTLACTSSVGPGALNMLTGAAAATVNRVPVLLLPGDIFARRNVAPVLQQLESGQSQDVSVNDCFKPVSRYWDRLNRPDQLLTALPEAMRVLTSPADTGAVTLCLPEDVQTEAFDYPAAFFEPRIWRIPRNRPDHAALFQAAAMIRASQRPLIVAGGGVKYSDATAALEAFARATGIPVGETMAGKGSLRYDDPLCVGAIGVTGSFAANNIALKADLVIGIGTRYSDFTTASKTQFQDPGVRFININPAEFDAAKHSGFMLTGDARATLEELLPMLDGWRAPKAHTSAAQALHDAWEAEVDKLYGRRTAPLPSQSELIGIVNEQADPGAIIVNAAGSMPGDLHKLWRARHPTQYHVEYGFSTMGYEVAGALGVKMADPGREVIALVGDGSYLMLANEVVTAVQEGIKLIIIIMDNRGYNSIGSLSRSLGQKGFGTRYTAPVGAPSRMAEDGEEAEDLPVDLAANARSLGARVIECEGTAAFADALHSARANAATTVICVRNDRYTGVPGHSWWDVPPAEVSESEDVQAARDAWAKMRSRERFY